MFTPNPCVSVVRKCECMQVGGCGWECECECNCVWLCCVVDDFTF